MGRLKVLVVCHGNVNRSPLCAAVLRKERPDWDIRQAALKAWNNAGWHDEPAARKMRDAAERHGLSLEGHRSTPIDRELLAWADYVIYMDNGNHRRLEIVSQMEGPRPGQRWVCLGSFIGPEHRVADPAFMAKNSPEFRDIVEAIISASRECARKMISMQP